MNRKKSLKSERKGFSLLPVLFAVIILLLIGWGLLSLGYHSQLRGIRAGSEIAARSAADAGLTQAVWQMNQKLEVLPWDDSNLPQVTDAALGNSDATFNYTVTGDLSNSFNIESLGRSGPTTKLVNATLRLQGVFDYGILVKETITLYTGTLVDGYNSGDPLDTAVPVQIATESTDEGSIILKPGASVDGDTLIGVDAYFPKVTAPVLPDMNAPITAMSTTITIGPGDSGKYTYLELKTDGILEVVGDVVLHIPGDFWMGQGTEIIIRPNSSLVLYLEGDLSAGNSSGINNETQIPESFIVYGIGQEQKFELKAKTDWYGAIYAPEADISIKAGADIYGSFIGTSFENKAGGFIFYDAALRDAKTTDMGVRFIVDRWSE